MSANLKVISLASVVAILGTGYGVLEAADARFGSKAAIDQMVQQHQLDMQQTRLSAAQQEVNQLRFQLFMIRLQDPDAMLGVELQNQLDNAIQKRDSLQ